MTKEEAIHEIEKVFEPAFANYIITALTEGATNSDEEKQSCEDMRDTTEEERKSTKDYIDSISKPTGLRFDDIYEELDFVQPHKKISVNLQPYEDYISRDAVRKLIWQNNDKYGYSDRFHEFTQKCLQLPSVTPQTRWIPISERLPEEEGLYIVSVKNDHDRRYSKTCWFHGNGNWFSRQDVEAWMPLPESYNAEKDVNCTDLCESCNTKGCIFQSGIARSHCDFYKTESEEEE